MNITDGFPVCFTYRIPIFLGIFIKIFVFFLKQALRLPFVLQREPRKKFIGRPIPINSKQRRYIPLRKLAQFQTPGFQYRRIFHIFIFPFHDKNRRRLLGNAGLICFIYIPRTPGKRNRSDSSNTMS